MNLPDRPSELIRLALADLRKAESDERYRIDMGTWHIPEEYCSVCLAGAVMAFSLGACHEKDLFPGDFTPNEGKLLAIDQFRSGNVASGLRELGWHWDTSFNRDVVPYHEDGEQFHTQMAALATDLEIEGL